MNFLKNIYVKIAVVSIFSFLVIFQIIYDIIALSNSSYLNSDFMTKELIITSLVISIILLALSIYIYIKIILQAIKK